MTTKAERVAEFLKRLATAPAAADHDSALTLIAQTLTSVEDELSGVPNDPTAWVDGRLYPPQADAARSVAEFPDVIRYRSRAHNTFVRSNGAIRIEAIGSNDKPLFEKPGQDGRHVFEAHNEPD